MKKRRKLDVACPNDACSFFGKKGMKNVVKRGFKKNRRFVYKVKSKIFGNPDYNDIETVNIESYNSVPRERIGCLVRRTKCFSKKRSMLEKHLDIFQAYNNTMKENADGEIPAVKENLTSKKWQWTDFFMYR